eukprot:GCRY01002723.1.p1 GENE.GCRY01002723.1~~GCRY01002723.1.p1  ORF type:complete len:274 (-),score=51.92 GCRY01002723.1:51-872(-)
MSSSSEDEVSSEGEFVEEEEEEEGEESEGEVFAADGTEVQSSSKPKPNDSSKKVKKLTKKQLKKFREDLSKRGIVYIARVPPFMKPAKIRHLLGQYGDIDRLYLTPEDPKAASLRKKAGGNRKKNYKDGWVEFLDKKIARTVAETLNNTQIGGKSTSHFKYDLWNLKYLPRFKWTHLSEKIAYDRKVREQKLNQEISQAKKINELYLKQVDQAKMIQSIEERKSKKRKSDAPLKTDPAERSVKRAMHQRTDVSRSEIAADSKMQKEVLDYVFR